MNSDPIHLSGTANELNTGTGVSGSAKPGSGLAQPRGEEQQQALIHLTPDQKNVLPEVVEQYAVTPALSTEVGELFSLNHFYALPPNQALIVHDGHFRVEVAPPHIADEKLQAVDSELQQRNNVLTQTGNDHTDLLDSVKIPLLLLASDLRILQFTPQVQKLLNVRLSDVGRPISEIRLQLSVENIEPILKDVLKTLEIRELEVQDREGHWHLLRVQPYTAAKNGKDGLAVVLLDIDRLRRGQKDLIDASAFANSVIESVPIPLVVLDQDFAIRTANAAFLELMQMPASDLLERSFPDLVGRLWGMDPIRNKLDELLNSPIGSVSEFEQESTTSQRRTLLFRGRALSIGGSRASLLALEDITLRRETEKRIAQQKEVLEEEIEVAARKLTRTREELRGLTAHLFALQEDERQRIARELHDDISQRLSLLEMLLHGIQSEDLTGDNQTRLESACAQLTAINTEVRQISHRLHPAVLQDLGLSAALKALVDEFGEREEMPATYITQNLPERWSSEAATTIYRIAQEALRNVAKHAGKTHVKVALSGDNDRLQLRVTDFGIGFDQEADMEAPGLGLISMQERARLAGGTLSVTSKLGEGVTVVVDVPVNEHA